METGIAIGVIIFILGIFLVFYLASCVPLYLYLKKSGIDHPWMAFVPMLNTYKMNHYIYDLFYGRKLERGEIPVIDYKSNRRTFSAIFLIGLLILSFIVGVISGFVNPNIMDTSYGGEPEYVNEYSIYDLLTFIITMASSTLIYIGMFYTVTKNGENMPVWKIVLYTFLTFITFGVSWIIQFIYYSISDKHGYRFNKVPGYIKGNGDSKDTDNVKDENVKTENVNTEDNSNTEDVVTGTDETKQDELEIESEKREDK